MEHLTVPKIGSRQFYLISCCVNMSLEGGLGAGRLVNMLDIDVRMEFGFAARQHL